ncbi:MAG: bifunctional UDP-sugar hydrolase/5'-nucleotidase [Candidatus Cohnella colombiensis]|uniref:Bifunctional UDP-sugar hydrolase/5'-nucleotidase n=1 Tax=Candidatus Cohnella colombiensis TaxID=3121368 RepID=A0AA95F5L7_9BACL|nr:MAG: bifunctional UDP-sugar hydrolase/5'-nucleotidase [Cohnella sp.]
MTDPSVTLTLLHTNDIHSHFEAVSQIAQYIAEVRENVDPNQLLLLDCGDFMDRFRMETEGTEAEVNRALLESLRYDAIVIGNNEGLTYSQESLEKLYKQLPIPVVCANMKIKNSSNPPDWMSPTLIVEKSGVKIGIVGVTAAFNSFYDLLGWEAQDPIAVVQQCVEQLREQADVIILLSHLGLRMDERIATSVDGIDLILGGHTHHLLETPLVIGSTAISAAGKYGQYIGHLELEIVKEQSKLIISGGCFPTAQLPSHRQTNEILKNYQQLAMQRMNREVAYLHEPLESDPNTESSLATLLAMAVRTITNAEIGIVNAGQLLFGLPKGSVSELTIHTMCPSPINACSLKLTGGQIKQALEESLLTKFKELEIRGFGFRGKVLGCLCIDGLAVTVDLSRADYDKIVSTRVNGQPLELDRKYTVGTLDMFTFGVGYLTLGHGNDVQYFLPHFIRSLLTQALNDQHALKECRQARWHFS